MKSINKYISLSNERISSIDDYITEKLKLKNVKKQVYKYHPQTKNELKKIIIEKVNEEGNDADLNDIDTSKITDMSALFNSRYLTDFCGDVSQWDVSNVTNMNHMFCECKHFNCDLSKWDVSRVQNMVSTFAICHEFEGKGLEKWNVSNVETMEGTFSYCHKLKGFELEYWDFKNVISTIDMFYSCEELCCDTSKWKFPKLIESIDMFEGCEKLKSLPKWYKK